MMPKTVAMFKRLEGGEIGNLPIRFQLARNAYQAAFVQAMADSHKTREQIADEMNLLLGPGVVSKGKLDGLARERSSKAASEWRFPARWISAFWEVTGSDKFMLLLMGARFRERFEAVDTTLYASAVVHEALTCLQRLTGRGRQKGNR
jgi:hypothetical protein